MINDTLKTATVIFREALLQKQWERQENSRQFADYLGIYEGVYSLFINAKRGPSNDLLHKVSEKFPDLEKFAVAAWKEK